jgi:menaquinone-dependent protoporphyrinogen oxidase
MAKILVAYASKRGSTREVADAIALRMREHGLEVDVTAAGDVGGLAGYNGLVVGGALYTGRWHADARRLLKRQRRVLAVLPFAVFAMGPRTTEMHDLAQSREQLDHALAKTPELAPVAVGVFGGVLDPTRLRFPFNRLEASDARDWEAIRAWADDIARKIEMEVPAAA